MNDTRICVLDPTAQIASTAVIGTPFRPLLDGRRITAERNTVIASSVWVGHFTVIGDGVTVGQNSLIEDYASIQARSTIGQRVVIASRSYIGIGASIGDDSVIKGHVGDASHVGAGCRIAGDLIHRQLDPTRGWDDEESEEPAPNVEDGAFVGWRAMVIGGVNIGTSAYICAGAIITRDVPAGHIASGRNRIIHHRNWRGPLAKSPFFT
jgi:UDP-3-O-[3-hydroxymyristoyl] glucosamine N-acyltransferase